MARGGRSSGPDDGSRGGNSTGYSESVASQLGGSDIDSGRTGGSDDGRSGGGRSNNGGRSSNNQSSGPDDGFRGGNTSTDRGIAEQSATQDRSTLESNNSGSGPDDGFRGVTSPVTGYGAPGPSANAVTGPENYGPTWSGPSLLSPDLTADWRGTMTPQTEAARTPGIATRSVTSVDVRSPRQNRGLSYALSDDINAPPDPYGLTRNQGSFVSRTDPIVTELAPVLEQARKDGRPTDPYNGLVWGNGTPAYAPLTQMTIAEVMDYQRSQMPTPGRGRRPGEGQFASKAVGAYQFTGGTLADIVAATGIDPNTPFNEATQDFLAAKLAERRGLDDYRSGAITAEEYADRLAGEWASFKGSSGRGQYDDDGINRGYVSFRDVVGAVNQIGRAPAGSPPPVEVLGPRVEVAAIPPQRPDNLNARPDDGIVVADAAPPEVPGRGLGFAALPPSRPDAAFSDVQAPGAAPSLRDDGAPLDVRPEVQRFAEKYLSPPASSADRTIDAVRGAPAVTPQVDGIVNGPGPVYSFQPDLSSRPARAAPSASPSVFDPNPTPTTRPGVGAAAAPAAPQSRPSSPSFPANPPTPPRPRDNGVPRVNPRVAAQEQIGPVIAQPSTTRQDGFAATGIDILAGAVPGLGIINGLSAALGGPSLGSLMTQYGAPGFDPTKGMTEADLNRDGSEPPRRIEEPEEEEDETEAAPEPPPQRFRKKYLYPTPEERWGGQQYRGGPELRGRAPVETQVPIT